MTTERTQRIAAVNRLRALLIAGGVNISLADLVREADAGRLFGVSTRTMRAWRHAGTGPKAVRVGGQHRYELAEIAEYLWQEAEEAAESGRTDVAAADEPNEHGADSHPLPRIARK